MIEPIKVSIKDPIEALNTLSITDLKFDYLCDIIASLRTITCPLTNKIFKEPVCAWDGIVYEAYAMDLFIRKNRIDGNPLKVTLPSGKPIWYSRTTMLTKPSNLMVARVQEILEKYPMFSSDVFDLEAYNVSLKIDFAKEVGIDFAYGQDIKSRDLENHKNFSLQSLMSEFTHITHGSNSIKRFLRFGSKKELTYLIDNLAYSESDIESINKFVIEFVNSAYERYISDTCYNTSNVLTQSIFETITEYLFEKHPIFKTIVFPTDAFNDYVHEDASDVMMRTLIKCGFKYNLVYTLKKFSGISVLNVAELEETCALDHALEVIDVILKNSHLDSESKIKMIGWLRPNA